MTLVVAEKCRMAPRRPWPNLLHRVVKTIRAKALVEKGHHLLIAVSGGPDSVALLSLMHRLQSSWRLTITAVHFNYGLRGTESDQDQSFVAALCHTLNISLLVRRLDVSRRARPSLQAEARELRYHALSAMADECGADRIAVGHTADDQAETVLLWMLRGSGLTGLSGMPASRDGTIVRPLIEQTREEILTYLKHEHLRYRQDSSNAKLIYRRNQIRHEVLPKLKAILPSSVHAICRLADLCREDEHYLDAQVADLVRRGIRRESDGWVVERTFIRQLPVALQRRLVRDLLRRCEPHRKSATAGSIERVLRDVVTGHHPSRALTVHRTRVVVRNDVMKFIPQGQSDKLAPSCAPLPNEVLPVPSELLWPGTQQWIRVEERDPGDVVAKTRGLRRVVVDADLLSTPLTVRPWRYGDRFYPMGMKGRSKKIQDFFVDLKIPSADRSQIPLVVAQEGIVWIPGYRLDERWAVTKKTRRCLVLAVSEKSHREGVS